MNTTPKRFTKRPVTIEAIQLTRENANEVAHWCGGHAIHVAKASDHTDVYTALNIPTLEGIMCGNVGDWIIHGVSGEFYPCKPDIFEATYQPAVTGEQLESE